MAYGALLVLLSSAGGGSGDAMAAAGDLTQKAGLAGCWGPTGLCSPGAGLEGAAGVTVSPDGRSAYVASLDGGRHIDGHGAVATFDRASDGTLTQKAGKAGCVSETGSGGACAEGRALTGAISVAVSPDGKNAYVASRYGAVAVFDRAPDGTLVQKRGTAGCVSQTGSGGTCADATALEGASSVTVSADGSSAYVAAFTSGAVAVFDRAADGALTQKPGTAGCISDTGSAGACADGTALRGAEAVTVSADGTSAYAAAFVSGAVAVFDRAPDGTLRQKPGTAGCISDNGTAGACVDGTGLDGARSVTIDPDGTNAYVASFISDTVVVLDRAPNGTLTQKPGTAGCISDTGTAGACTDATALDGAEAVTLSADGASAYVAARFSGAVVVFDREDNGALTQKPGIAGCISDTGGAGACADGAALDGAFAVTVSADDTSVYVASVHVGAVAVFDREPLPAAPRAPTPVVARPQAAARTPPPPVGHRDQTRPILSALALTPRRLAPAGRGESIGGRGGSRVAYNLSEVATVRFTVERGVAGRRVGGRCVKPKRSNRSARRCTRYTVMAGGFTHRGKAGHNTFRFSGRIGNRKLAAGRYRLRCSATDPSGNASEPRRIRFEVRAAKRRQARPNRPTKRLEQR